MDIYPNIRVWCSLHQYTYTTVERFGESSCHAYIILQLFTFYLWNMLWYRPKSSLAEAIAEINNDICGPCQCSAYFTANQLNSFITWTITFILHFDFNYFLDCSIHGLQCSSWCQCSILKLDWLITAEAGQNLYLLTRQFC